MFARMFLLLALALPLVACNVSSPPEWGTTGFADADEFTAEGIDSDLVIN